MEEQLIKIGKAAIYLGVSTQTIRNYERIGILIPAKKTSKGTRYYKQSALEKFLEEV